MALESDTQTKKQKVDLLWSAQGVESLLEEWTGLWEEWFHYTIFRADATSSQPKRCTAQQIYDALCDLHKMKFPTVPNVLLQPLYEDAQNMPPELLPVFLEHIVFRTGAHSSPYCSEEATTKPLISH